MSLPVSSHELLILQENTSGKCLARYYPKIKRYKIVGLLNELAKAKNTKVNFLYINPTL